MEVLVARVRCMSPPEGHEVQSFPATTCGLLALADWLEGHGCTAVAMEATGAYWRPNLGVVAALEDALQQVDAAVGKSGTRLKTTLVTAAWAAVLTRNTYLHTQFLRIKSRRGAKKAILAVAASMLTAAYRMLRDGVEYRDLGVDHYDRRDRSRAITRLVRRLHDLGCQVEIKQAA